MIHHDMSPSLEAYVQLACARKVVSLSLPSSYWCMSHADICEPKGIKSYELECAHKKRNEISPEKIAFLDCVVVSKSRL
jgi:hypothetical protein